MVKKIPEAFIAFCGDRLHHIGDDDEQTRFLQYCVVACVAVVTMVSFGIYSWFRGATTLAIVLLVISIFLVVGWYSITRGLRPRYVYRLNSLLFSILLIYLLFLGGKDNSMLFWINIAPLVMFFFMGRSEGLLWTAGVWLAAVLFFFGPYEFQAREGYTTSFAVRCLVSYGVIAYITYFYENFRHIYRLDLEEKHRKLQAEVRVRELVEQSLRESEERYRAIYLQAAEGIMLINFTGQIVECNPQMLQMLEYEEDELIGTNIFSLFHPESLQKTPPQLDRLKAGETILVERQLRSASGIYLLCEQSGKKIGDDLIILLYRDIRERKIAEMALEKANEALERLAHIDGLTQIANRRRFDSTLEQEWQRMSREKKYLGLILCDIDYFKKYNDIYGHQAGDECLRSVAGALEATVHRPADLVARYGGEEFAILLPDTDFAGSARIAEKMRTKIESLKIAHRGSRVHPYLTVSFGVHATIPGVDKKVADLINTADRGLYLAKEAGKNRVAGENGTREGEVS